MAHTLPTPRASTERVADWVALVMSGRVRIPVFQRGLKWKADDVVALFESLLLGYPVGSFLFHRGPAEAEPLQVGPLGIAAPELEAALWVVDGQQRLVALTAGLARPDPIPRTPDDDFVVYFDADAQVFRSPPKNAEIPTTWVPLTQLLDASKLSEWVFQWPHGPNESLRRIVFNAGTRIREYVIPAYTVDTDDEDVLREVFHRVNRYGKRLEWTEVHDALYGRRGPAEPSTLPELADALARVGMGRPDEEQLLRCLIAFAGQDVTRSFDEHHRRNPSFLAGAVTEASPTLRRVLDFLRSHGRISHLLLLPWSAPLTVLTRFFRLHPDPNARSLQLLRRWLWRSILGERDYEERSFQRHGIAEIDDDEEASIQRLLAFLPKLASSPFVVPANFDAREAESRIALLGLASFSPRDPANGRIIDLTRLIEDPDFRVFRKIVGKPAEVASSPANRVLLPGKGRAVKDLLDVIQNEQTSFFSTIDRQQILGSHAISPAAAEALAAGDHERFIAERKQTLEQQIIGLGATMAEWSANDRPSIDYLIAQSESEHGTAV